MKTLPVGKLSWDYLAELFTKHASGDGRVVVGPRIGEDAAVIDLGDSYLVATTDPITFATDAIGYYAVQVNANDLATMNAVPRWFLATLLLPEGKTAKALVSRLFAEISRACRQMEVSLVGGHTEVTAGLGRPIVVGTMLGQMPKERLVTSSGLRAGDLLILTKGIAVEATALIAREKEDELKVKYSSKFVARCKRFIYQPGIGVLRDANISTGAARVHAMHDPTEGGLATGLREMALASGVALQVNRDAINILPETARLCGEYGLDPLGAIASGALLVGVEPGDARRILDALRAAGITAEIIAQAVEGDAVCWRDGSPLPSFDRDELARLFETG